MATRMAICKIIHMNSLQLMVPTVPTSRRYTPKTTQYLTVPISNIVCFKLKIGLD